MKKRKTDGCRAAVLLTALILALGKTESKAAAELYAAGIPDAWPMEYYDKDTGTYQGVIPDLLRQAGQDAGITVRYIQPSGEDVRLELAGNVQVDMVCTLGLTAEELTAAGLEPGSIVLSYIEEGRKKDAALAYTKSMERGDRKRLEAALAELDEAQIRGRYLYYARKENRGNYFWTEYDGILLIAFGCSIVLLSVVSFGFSRKKRKIEWLAYRDDVTGKSNFADWKRKMNEVIVEENRELYAVTFLSGGIDVISHIYGYEEVHHALGLISDVCEGWVIPKKEGFARFNNYYFVFYLQFTNEQALKERAAGLYKELELRFQEEKKKYFLELNMGIYKLTAVDKDPLKAIQYSEVAAEYGKSNYLRTVTYDEMVEKETISGYAMEHETIHGLIHQEFILYLQPILELKTGKICGAEALVRWQNPNRGLLGPAEFLHIMKKKQILGKMDLDIYRQGCRFLQEEAERGNELHLMFNFTAENIRNEHFADTLKATAEQFGVKTDRIMIQLNLMDAGAETKAYGETIRKLRRYGFDVWLPGLELDETLFEFLDCGVNGIKLRHELTRQITHPKGRMVMENIVSLCHELDLEVLCVGAENEAQVEGLKQLGCRLVSGKYFYYPVTPESFGTLLGTGGKREL